jgi:hypothetical protein
MDRFDEKLLGDYTVTVFNCTDFTELEIKVLIRKFRRELGIRLGIPKRILEIQYDYNRLADKYGGTPLPSSASLEERLIVEQWEGAYEAALHIAFKGIRPPPEDAYFAVHEPD